MGFRPVLVALALAVTPGCSGILDIGAGESSQGGTGGGTGETGSSGGAAATSTATTVGTSGPTTSTIPTATGGGEGGYGPCGVGPCPADPEEACVNDDAQAPTWSVCATLCSDVNQCPAPDSGNALVTCEPLTPGLPAPTGCILRCDGAETCPDGMTCIQLAGVGDRRCVWGQ